MAVQNNDLYIYGDVYETIDACDQLEDLLGRLRGQRLMSDYEWIRNVRQLREIRHRIEQVAR